MNGKLTNTTATKQHKIVTVNNWILMSLGFRAQELCESRGGRPGLPVPNKTLWFLSNDITSYGG